MFLNYDQTSEKRHENLKGFQSKLCSTTFYIHSSNLCVQLKHKLFIVFPLWRREERTILLFKTLIKNDNFYSIRFYSFKFILKY